WLFPLIKQSNEAGIYTFDVGEVIKRHPSAKDYAIRDAKIKLESVKIGLDRSEEGSASNKFTSYQKGVGMIKPLLKIVGQAVFSPDFLVNEILDTFQSAVASPGFLVWHYHTGERTLVEHVVKDLPNGGIELAYLYLHVKG